MNCLTPKCKGVVHCHGLCLICYQDARVVIEEKGMVASWAELEKMGLCKLEHPFLDALSMKLTAKLSETEAAIAIVEKVTASIPTVFEYVAKGEFCDHGVPRGTGIRCPECIEEAQKRGS